MEQRWFCGVHSNIGGGYVDARLNDIALGWMMAKASAVGLAIDKNYQETHVHPGIDGKLYNSSVFPFNLFGPVHRIISAKENFKASIDDSVLTKWSQNEKYRPKNLEHVMEKLNENGSWP